MFEGPLIYLVTFVNTKNGKMTHTAFQDISDANAFYADFKEMSENANLLRKKDHSAFSHWDGMTVHFDTVEWRPPLKNANKDAD